MCVYRFRQLHKNVLLFTEKEEVSYIYYLSNYVLIVESIKYLPIIDILQLTSIRYKIKSYLSAELKK